MYAAGQASRQLDSSHSISALAPDKGAHGTSPSTAHTLDEGRQAQRQGLSRFDELHKLQHRAKQKAPHTSAVQPQENSVLCSKRPQAAQEPAAGQRPGKRLGPMQAAKLALAKICTQRPAARIALCKRSCPSSQPNQTAQPAAKRARLAGADKHRIQAASTCGDAQQRHLSRKSHISAGAVCAKCEKAIPLSAATCADAWACRGACCQSFHSACAQPRLALTCFECTGGMRVCFFCKRLAQAAQLAQCAMAGCGRFYHSQCAAR